MIQLLNEIDEPGYSEKRTANRHLKLSLVVVLLQTLLWVGLGFAGYVVMAPLHWLTLIIVIWVISLVLAWWVNGHAPILIKGENQTLGLTLWATSCFLITSYFLDDFRISAVMFFFPIIIAASFRLNLKYLLIAGCYAVLGYLFVLILVNHHRPLRFELSTEMLQWFVLTVVTVSFAIFGRQIYRVKNQLVSITRQVKESAYQARETAIRDELTGIYNRRYILDALAQQKAMADEMNYPFVVCYLDLDHFKQINDAYGHQAGDLVLAEFGRVMQSHLRKVDFCGRMGGEEFIVVLSHSDLAAAVKVIERLRLALAKIDFSHVMKDRTVTVSAGLTSYQKGESIEQVLARADELLYQAKETGRNKAVAAEAS